MHPADEALIAQDCTIISKNLRDLLHHTSGNSQVAAAGFWVPLKVKLLQLGDVDQAGLKVLVGALFDMNTHKTDSIACFSMLPRSKTMLLLQAAYSVIGELLCMSCCEGER